MTSIYPSSTSSTSSSTSSANLLRISGMASGIDTDSVVKSMVSNYQSKIDKASQAKQILQWKQDAYRDIIKDIKGLQDYFDPLSSKYVLTGNSFNTKSVNNADSTKFSATTSSSAKPGTYTVDVKQLAEQAEITGTSLDTLVPVDAADVAKWSEAKLTIGGTAIQLDSISDSNGNGILDEVAANINAKISQQPALNGKVSASYVNDGTNSYIRFTSTSSMSLTVKNSTETETLGSTTIKSAVSASTKLSDLGFNSNLSFDLSYDTTTATTPVTITATSTDTLQSLIDKVNSQTSGAVTMSIDDTTGKISFQSKNYGSSSNITIKNNTANISNLGITIAVPADGITGTGKDAMVDITEPGKTTATTTTQTSNKFTMNGMTYSLVNIGKTTSTVTASSDTVVSNMKKFIEDYNSIISKINTKLTEKKDSDYAPLTDAQKESMSESQITSWETKAKVGILRNDDYLSSLLTELRGAFSSPVYSSYTDSSTNTKVALSFGSYGTSAIGIDTSNTDWTDGGKLYIDDTKLKNAIDNNIEDFKKLFIGASDNSLSKNESYIGSTKYKEDGIFKRMDTILRDYVASPGMGEDGTYTYSGKMNIFVNKQYNTSSFDSSGQNTLPDQVYSKTLSISKLKTQMSAAETRYYNKFTALETAMNKLNSQQSQLASMLGTSS